MLLWCRHSPKSHDINYTLHPHALGTKSGTTIMATTTTVPTTTSMYVVVRVRVSLNTHTHTHTHRHIWACYHQYCSVTRLALLDYCCFVDFGSAGTRNSFVIKQDGSLCATGTQNDGELGIGAKGSIRTNFVQVISAALTLTLTLTHLTLTLTSTRSSPLTWWLCRFIHSTA